MDAATTGISGLDAQLGGGVPRGSTILVLGDPCNALGAFAEQFIAGGLAQAEPCLYVQFDRPARSSADRIRQLAQDLGGVKGPLQIVDGYTASFNGHGQWNGHDDAAAKAPGPSAPLQDVLKQLESMTGRYRLAIDSLSTVAGRGHEDEAVAFFRELVHRGHLSGGLHFVTLIKGLHDPQTEARFKHLATGVMEIGYEKKGFGLYNYLQVTKLMEMRDPTRLLLFRETDKGLWLESTKRVF